ncbi:hypothetical protein B7494_g1222 [Chlorociboria aeruginascens]|nr:hypothetical protein B7494_g1222 [Chlorociboria aeruginascens]
MLYHAKNSASILGAFTTELDRITPKFEIPGSKIQVLRSPAEFYEELKISTLQQALRSKPKLKLSILTDALRGTRESPEPSCASLLAPLVTEFGKERVEIRMYHTPNLTGLRKQYIPKRINEGWGLQHMKLYGVDDEIIISGANLSNDYFTNRQDRYHVFSSKEITEYFSKIHNAVSKLSFLVNPELELQAGYTLEWPASNSAPSPLSDPTRYVSLSTSILTNLISTPTSVTTPPTSSENKTLVYPISQFTPLLNPDKSTELPAIRCILTLLSSPTHKTSSWTFTAGYFNPDPSLTKLLLSTSSSSNTVITASPEANGFYGSKGVSGLLPAAYTLLSRRFLNSVLSSPSPNSTILKEWRRGTVGEKDGWTYHAKGLWVSLNGEREPSISVIGSSNYTKRSYGLDLEVGTVIVTADKGLKARLAEERDGLQEFARQVDMMSLLR